jgi:uncharacterized membrane protein
VNLRERIIKLVFTGIMMCLIIIATMFIRVPIPFTQGYVHLGDAMIFLSVLVLGWRYGAVAAGVGSALADILIGYAVWAPWTLCIKAGMAVLMGMFIARSLKKERSARFFLFAEFFGMTLAGIWMCGGYYIAEAVIYGNWATPALAVPWNIGQFVVGMVIAISLAAALYKTSAAKHFTYRFDAANKPNRRPDSI